MSLSHRASNSLVQEERANLSKPRLGHQTGPNQLPYRERAKGQEGGSEVAAAAGGMPVLFFFLI